MEIGDAVKSRLPGGEGRQLLLCAQAHGDAHGQCGGAELPRQTAG